MEMPANSIRDPAICQIIDPDRRNSGREICQVILSRALSVSYSVKNSDLSVFQAIACVS